VRIPMRSKNGLHLSTVNYIMRNVLCIIVCTRRCSGGRGVDRALRRFALPTGPFKSVCRIHVTPTASPYPTLNSTRQTHPHNSIGRPHVDQTPRALALPTYSGGGIVILIIIIIIIINYIEK